MHTVYLVDDDKIVLDDFMRRRDSFLAGGFRICGCETNPIDALAEIREKRPSAVFSDLKMPELTGIGMLEALRCDALPPPHFVIISAYNEFEDVRRFFSHYRGFDYILKPVSDRDLSELLIRLSARIDKLSPVVRVKAETPSRELNEILKHLTEYPSMNHTLENLGALFSINPNTVCNLFAKHLNTTFIAYLKVIRLKRASELLRTTNITVKSVGISCGYPNYFYFTRLFTKTFGKTPTEYREMGAR